MAVCIRLAVPSDGEALSRIYAPYVEDTAVSFELTPPTAKEFAARIAATAAVYPYLVYEDGGAPVGYAYASRHRERAAYRYDVDVSIYVAPAYHGRGAAQALYSRLFALLAALGYRNAYAAYTEPNEPSRRFHAKCDFTVIGTFRRTGYKFGKWHDVTWAEKVLGAPEDAPGALRTMRDLPEAFVRKICAL